MDFRFLYDSTRHLFAIGYNVDKGQRDASYYDLLASEARLPCFVAIAQGQVPQESWFALGRMLTSAGDRPILLSWSGSMFEYLMPLLVMPTYENTLLDETCLAAVERQIAYGRQLGVPWGMSESCYNTVDSNLNYQYRAFGVPGLGLKRGLAEDVVIAPYASALALMVAPEAACLNLQRLAAEGLAGQFGLFEAIDYTPARLPRGQTSAVVRSFMAHHQAMSVLALRALAARSSDAEALRVGPAVPGDAAAAAGADPERGHVLSARHTSHGNPRERRRIGNGGARHHESRHRDPRSAAAVERPLPRDGHEQRRGQQPLEGPCGHALARRPHLRRLGRLLLRPRRRERRVLVDRAPADRAPADHYEAIFSVGRAEFRRRDHGLEIHTEIAVSPEDDIELRRARIVNRSRTRKVIELTTYAEIVLAPPAEDIIHPAFSKLFVQTEIARDKQAILATRRPRSAGEHPPWMFHLIGVHGAAARDVSYETDRMRFVGRGNTLAAPRAMLDRGAAVRQRRPGARSDRGDPRSGSRIEPAQTVTVDMVYGVADSREAAIALVDKYQDPPARRSRRRARVDACAGRAAPDRRVGERLAALRAACQLDPFREPVAARRSGVIARNRRSQSGLWGYAISGDLPIVLLRIADVANIDLVRQLVQAHAFWRLKGLAVDLVIWNEDRAGYRQVLQEQIMGLVAAGVEAQLMNRPGGIFVRPGDQISEEDRVLIESAARAIICDSKGTLAEQIGGPRAAGGAHAEIRAHARAADRGRRRRSAVAAPAPRQRNRRLFRRRDRVRDFDGCGPPDARALGERAREPALRDGRFRVGRRLHVERERARIPPDAMEQRSGERCERRGLLSARRGDRTRLVGRRRCRHAAARPYVARHGFGYTVFEHSEGGIATELWVFVARDAPVKFSLLKIRNTSERARRISVTGYVEWVLGETRTKSAMHIVTEKDGKTGALFARNPFSIEFGGRVAFFDVDDTTRTFTCDRTEFIGRTGTLAAPAAMDARASVRTNRAGARPVRGASGDARARARRRARSDLQARRRARRGRRARAGHALPRRDRSPVRARRSAPSMAADARCRPRRDARSGARRALQRLASLSDARARACGGAAASTNPAARSVSATSCRMRSRCCTPIRV